MSASIWAESVIVCVPKELVPSLEVASTRALTWAHLALGMGTPQVVRAGERDDHYRLMLADSGNAEMREAHRAKDRPT